MTPGELRLTMPVGPSQNDLPALLRALADRLEADGTGEAVGEVRIETELNERGAKPVLYATINSDLAGPEPLRRPSWYGIRSTLVSQAEATREERVVLFRVSSFAEAILLAQEDVAAYLRDRQDLESLGDYEAFRIASRPGHGIEVFSHTVSVATP